jgi:glucose-1-phosphate thymidylyltransferase
VKGLLLAGGHGTRLRPLTFSGNKHMIPIANQPILFYGLKHLAQAGIHDIGIVLGPLQEGIRESVGSGQAFGVHVSYIHQGDPKGLAHAVLCAREFLGDDPFVMYLGDNLLQEGVGEFVQLFDRERPDAVVGVMPVVNPHQFGIVELEGDRIVSVEEKPAQPKSDLALIGVYLFSPAIHAAIDTLHPSRRGELEITEAIWKLNVSGHRVLPHRVTGWWKDTGRPEDLLEANQLVLSTLPPESFLLHGVVARSAALHGSVGIGAGTIVEDDVEITGPTLIGAGARIEAGSRIGPLTTIGNGATLRGVAIRRSIVMDGTHIDGHLRIANSLIGRNVDIRSASESGTEASFILGDAAVLRL